MIPVFAGVEQLEARRIHGDLIAAGIPARIVEDLDAQERACEGIALVHFTHINKVKKRLGLTRLIAFGGADRADIAVRSLQQGATEYLPEGAHVTRISEVIQSHVQTSDLDSNKAAIAQSDCMVQLLKLASRVAQADISVLISGESGTGKEVIAREIHTRSNRADGPFIAVNCAAIPETMLEAVLFGHDKGAFTGASEKRLGKFELADGGTLLLDEITEMPVSLQAKLLRVLQEREVERIGSNKPTQVDVRVLATSNRDLTNVVADGHLREDLFYRLSVFPLTLPPLRERRADILPLAAHFLRKHATGGTPKIGEEASTFLQHHNWPGNVRELENCMQRAMVLCIGDTIQIPDLGLDMRGQAVQPDDASFHQQMRSKGDELLLDTLDENGGVRKTTALQLGISERTLRYKLKQLRDRGILI